MSTTLKKCLKIFETMALSESPRGISELARELDLDKSAVQRIFQTLLEEGYVEKNETSRYRPTLKLWELGAQVISRNESRRLIRPILRYASKVSELTSYLAWADFPDIIYLDKVEGSRGRTNSSDPGQRIPMHLTASGRAVLAFYEQSITEALIARLAADPVDTDFNPQELQRELETIRNRLYAATERGSASRVSSVAAPVWNSEGVPVGSVVLTSDSTTFPTSEFDRIGTIAMSAADQATRVLGGVVPVKELEAP